MQLSFKKDKKGEPSVFIKKGSKEEPFSYVEMVKSLVDNNKFKKSVYDKNITKDEKAHIEKMIIEINEVVESNVAEEKDSEDNA